MLTALLFCSLVVADNSSPIAIPHEASCRTMQQPIAYLRAGMTEAEVDKTLGDQARSWMQEVPPPFGAGEVWGFYDKERVDVVFDNDGKVCRWFSRPKFDTWQDDKGWKKVAPTNPIMSK
jgi:hypothetical protein